ncbi:SpoIIE family protein phosphatase [Promicromonospora sp. MEB111]|uniref:SpoIIE family protein phosphatase n=1 Tax=Promicromonospora sp. MEB111 TaxID=3040301 RepID=UPI00254AAA82|nr:SpoIIE family protein phosphatase [Promicromonospora sp. MEB111]
MRSGWFEEATARSAVGHEARTVAWEATPLGPPSTWPESLRHAVRLCFSTRFPVMMVWGPDLTLIYNDGYRDMLGTAKHPAALGASARVVWAEIWDDIGPLFDTVLATGRPTLNEDLYLLMNRSGYAEETYFTFSYSPLLDDDGRVVGVLDIATETTRAVVNQRRLALLGEVHGVLPGTFTDLRTFAQPVIGLLAASPDVARVALYAASGPEVVLEAGDEPEPSELRLVVRALRSGRRQVVPGTVVKPVRSGQGSGVIAALVLRGTAARPWDADHARFMVVLSTTVTSALRDVVRRRVQDDALRLRAVHSEEERARASEVSLALQRAVLTDPPRLDDLEVVVHYQPAAVERNIGGDWYDAFTRRDGATTVVIGDVIGHDLDAAVAMGQIRSLVRAIGYDSQETPARVLERVDAAIDGLALGSSATATALVACVERPARPGGDEARTVRWSSAGHLPPILVRADGTTEVLRIRNDLLLGMDPGTLRRDHVTDLRPGDTLVLYTDGLIETRDDRLRARLDKLAEVLEGTQTADLGTVVETALSGMLSVTADDDVAIVMVRCSARPGAPVNR